LKRIHQLTGIADDIYAEAAVLVHDYDITLEMLVMNRSGNLLKDLSVELATVGDLKLVDHPQTYTVPAGDSLRIRSNIKVSSTESAHIYGTIVYTPSGASEKVYTPLSDIHIDIMDYIHPATCTDVKFRACVRCNIRVLCCSVLLCAALCCSVLLCAALCCSVLYVLRMT